MPYIKEEDRIKFRDVINEIDALSSIKTKGELEYLIFTLMIRYKDTHEVNYSSLHDCCYAAAHCADEFRRRFLDVREDEARDLNGDI